MMAVSRGRGGGGGGVGKGESARHPIVAPQLSRCEDIDDSSWSIT